MKTKLVREKVVQHFRCQSLSREQSFDDNTNLFESGIIDSINAIGLVIFLENEFGIQVSSGDLTGGNFQSINTIVAFIASKHGAANG